MCRVWICQTKSILFYTSSCDLLIQYVLLNPVPGTEQAAFSCFFFANTVFPVLDDFGKCHWGAHTSLPSDRRKRSRRWAAKCQGDLRMPAALKLHPPSQRLFHIFADNERIVTMAVEMGDCSHLVVSKTSWKSEKLSHFSHFPNFQWTQSRKFKDWQA